MLIQPTLRRLVLPTGLLLSFLVYLVSINFLPVSINLVYITFILISIFRGIDAAIMYPSFHSITHFISKYSIFIWFHCVILWTGDSRSRACAMLYLELIICRRPILFEHNYCTSTSCLRIHSTDPLLSVQCSHEFSTRNYHKILFNFT